MIIILALVQWFIISATYYLLTEDHFPLTLPSPPSGAREKRRLTRCSLIEKPAGSIHLLSTRFEGRGERFMIAICF
jgi:hypothetical protein